MFYAPSLHLLILPLLGLGLSSLVAEGTNVPATISSNPSPTPVVAEILTPKPASTPRITGPKIFGVRPGNPFLFTVTATGDKPMTVSVTWAELGIKGPKVVRDLWRQKDLGTFNDKFDATVPSHGVVLVKMSPAK